MKMLCKTLQRSFNRSQQCLSRISTPLVQFYGSNVAPGIYQCDNFSCFRSWRTAVTAAAPEFIENTSLSKIRNVAIVAHVDHGKVGILVKDLSV